MADGFRVGGHVVPEGTIVTLDGTGGEIVLGVASSFVAAHDPHLGRLREWADAAAVAGHPARTANAVAKPV